MVTELSPLPPLPHRARFAPVAAVLFSSFSFSLLSLCSVLFLVPCVRFDLFPGRLRGPPRGCVAYAVFREAYAHPRVHIRIHMVCCNTYLHTSTHQCCIWYWKSGSLVHKASGFCVFVFLCAVPWPRLRGLSAAKFMI